MMFEKTKLKAGCGLFMVFSAGFLCGAIALFLLIVNIIPLSEGWRDEESKEFVINHLANKLSFTEEQLEQAKPIVYQALEERYEHRKIYVEADIELTRTAFEDLKPILTEQQVEKAKQMFKNWKEGKKRFVLGQSASPVAEPDNSATPAAIPNP